MKTFKHEEIYCNQYRDEAELRAHIEEFIDGYYNRQRLHSALGYRTPEEFEQDEARVGSDGSAKLDAAQLSYFDKPAARKAQEAP